MTPPMLPLGYEDVAVRGGWWGVTRQGSATKVGEYQDLASSPFWDLDLLRSDGDSTLDLFGTGLDNETHTSRPLPLHPGLRGQSAVPAISASPGSRSAGEPAAAG